MIFSESRHSHYPLKRVMLEQPNLEECIKLLKKHRTCSANAVICDGEGKSVMSRSALKGLPPSTMNIQTAASTPTIT